MSKSPESTSFIELQPDGPITVTGLTHFMNSRGEPIASSRTIALCRCGASKNKPFCDGRHVAAGFRDAVSADRVPDTLDEYAGAHVTVFDNRRLCSHAGFCTSDLPSVWSTSREPWTDPDTAPPDDVVAVVRRCPSGALSYRRGAARETEYSTEPEIRISRNGPYLVRGGVEIRGAELGPVPAGNTFYEPLGCQALWVRRVVGRTKIQLR